jgi:hypothetical protein
VSLGKVATPPAYNVRQTTSPISKIGLKWPNAHLPTGSARDTSDATILTHLNPSFRVVDINQPPTTLPNPPQIQPQRTGLDFVGIEGCFVAEASEISRRFGLDAGRTSMDSTPRAWSWCLLTPLSAVEYRSPLRRFANKACVWTHLSFSSPPLSDKS